MRRLTSLAVLLLATLPACTPDVPAPEPRTTEPETPAAPERADALPLAPDFTLTALDGEPFTLSEHRGEVVVLNFWATWCLPCLAEMPALEALHQDLSDEGVRVVGISQDTGGADEIRPFAAELDVTYPLLPDPAFTVAARYGSGSVLPTTIFVDREGRIAREEVGALTGDELRAMVDALR